MNRRLIASLILIAAPASAQTIYKCPSPTPGAPPVIQQMPCSPTGGGETVKVDAPKASGEGGLRQGEKDMLLKSDPQLRLKTLERDLVDAQIRADDANEKASASRTAADAAAKAK